MADGLRRHLTFANVGVIVALVLAGSGFAVAAIPGPGGVIQGCLDKRTGSLRVIDSGKHCTRRERAIRWNQQGRPGATGATGAAGAQGARGSDAQFNGAAAGGDLTGSYPSPTVRPGAITGAGVAADSLSGAHIDESTLARVPDATKLGGVVAGAYARKNLGTLSPTNGGSSGIGFGLGTYTLHCTAAGTQVDFKNTSGGPVDVWIDDSTGTTSTPFHSAVADQGLVSTSDTGPLGGVRRVTISAVPTSGSSLTTANDHRHPPVPRGVPVSQHPGPAHLESPA
jgi:hypothetical protein